MFRNINSISLFCKNLEYVYNIVSIAREKFYPLNNVTELVFIYLFLLNTIALIACLFASCSWDELGMYDIPAMIKYVQKITDRDKIVHMGHSMGTTSFYAMLSKKPEMNDKILAHISLAPVAYMDRMRSLEVLRPITLIIKQLIVSNQKNLNFKIF